MTTYLLAGGGTAGHVNPLIALADEIRAAEPDATVLALGTKEGLESRLVPASGLQLLTIPRLPFPRRPSRYALTFPVRYLRTVRHVRSAIRAHHVDVVVGFGGYVSTPAYAAAKAERVPYVIHEANALPGLANRLGARSTPYVAVTFPGTPIRNASVTGMPLRRSIVTLDRIAQRESARRHFGLDPDRPTLLVTGGSLGARGINLGISRSAHEIVESGAQVLHVWGGLTEREDPEVPHYSVITYCDEMELAFAAADVVVSRAGATTVSELSGLGIPSVFSPYRSGNGEQALNCRAVVEAGGALRVDDDELTPSWVRSVLIPLLHDPDAQRKMGELARTVGTLDGTHNLWQMVQRALAASRRS